MKCPSRRFWPEEMWGQRSLRLSMHKTATLLLLEQEISIRYSEHFSLKQPNLCCRGSIALSSFTGFLLIQIDLKEKSLLQIAKVQLESSKHLQDFRKRKFS
mmetsp:Transcript_8395/g.28185  ORF Transcript_8395/g.28185 Transcript_8395/m.28185 type:complete len:101 (-) Transcript_8395:882-1184(-)